MEMTVEAVLKKMVQVINRLTSEGREQIEMAEVYDVLLKEHSITKELHEHLVSESKQKLIA
ncbi:hypothetical protein IHV10_22230 [Fictibacillus sp. 5RED26]|jgi:hypothetical protein|uniref:hypothetical protein n=1 Tax=Fictibacillus sp. 5RED26 TaxID=2745876 RepID=UPI0018CE72CB|nr:hypothetical protein [Fictibacillus sp. 5RED26]MBH0159091.1 hypothetical protein [Fictibacillus sp. 5RED26]